MTDRYSGMRLPVGLLNDKYGAYYCVYMITTPQLVVPPDPESTFDTALPKICVPLGNA